MNRSLCSTLVALALLTCAPSSFAFCRTTTCDQDVSCDDDPEICCDSDLNGCATNGEPVSWPTSCVSYNVHDAGSELRGITQEEFSAVLTQAFDSWLSVDCNGEMLSLSTEDRGVASCGTPVFNEDPGSPNANVWMFQDDPELTSNVGDGLGTIDASSLAVSVITYDVDHAELVDVDVEFNSASAVFTLGDDDVQFDLLSVATHEAGHFLGLEHSLADGATMRARYTPGDIAPRTLTADDQAGICAAYPADRKIESENRTCEPYGGYTTQCSEKKGCGCKTAGRTSPADSRAWLLVALAGLAVSLRRRRGSRLVS